MNNSDRPAMPLANADLGLGGDDLGLSKREHFAALAMQGLLACEDRRPEGLIREAVEHADALLAALEKDQAK